MSILNAITSGAGGVALSGDTSGNLVIQSAGTNVAVFTSTGMITNVGAPAFSAYLNGSTQNISSGTATVAILDAKEWDTGSCFNNTGSTVTLNGLSTPAYAFCPNVAGYYQVNCQLRLSGTAMTNANIQLYKNGANLYRLYETASTSNGGGFSTSGSVIVYLNGTGDYLTLTGTISATSPNFNNSGSQYTSRMQASLVRSA